MTLQTKLPGSAIQTGTISVTAITNFSGELSASLPPDVVSSSAQVKTFLPTDTVSSSAQVTAFLPTGTVSSSGQLPSGIASSSAQVIAYLPTDSVSSSAQVTAFLPTGTVSSSTQLPSGIASSSAQVIAYLPTGTVSSSTQVDVFTTIGGNTLATTGSNTFTAAQTISDTTNSTSYLDGALHVAGGMSVRKDVRISGSMTINGLLTAVSMSTQYVTSSQYNVGVSRITLNDDDNVRFAGLSIIDSGSSSPTSASIFWDSLQHRFIYENLSGSAYNSSIIIAGPKHTGSLGDESTLTSGYVPYATGTDHIDNSVIYQSGSNIGIGTTSVTSGYKLDVRGLIYSYVASGNTGFVAQTNTNANAALNAIEGFGLELNTDATNRNLRFSSNNTALMTILSGGNVGIGTTNPGGVLDIRGSGTSADNNAYIRWAADSTGYAPGFNMYKARGTITSPTAVLSGDQLGVVLFGGYDGSAYQNGAYIESRVDGTPGSGDMPGRLGFYTTADGSSTPTERMRINSSGNVGIGTSPAVTLDVGTYGTNAVYATGRAVDGSVAFFSSVATLGGIRINTEAYGSATSAYLDLVNIQSKDLAIPSGFRIIGGVGAGAGTNNAYLAFSRFQMNGNGTVTASEYMRVDTSGNVGIGTNGPKNKLHVNGSVQVGFVDAINDALVLSWNGASSYGSIQTFSSSHLALNPSGNNVGIGTTNPSARLNIAHPNHGVAIDAISSYYGSVGGIFSSAASSTYPFNVYGNIIIATRPDFGGFYDIVFTTAASNNTPVERMVVKSSGNVGIGTTNPTYKVSTQGTGDHRIYHYNSGTTTSDNAIIQAEVAGDNSGNAFFCAGKTGTVWSLGRNTSTGNFEIRSNFNLANDASSRMIINTSGNVGIGVTNPAEKLELRSGYFRMSDPSSNAGAGYDIQWSSNSGGTNAVYASIVGVTTVSGARTGELRFGTSNAGAPSLRLTIGSTGNVVPGANGTQDLGSSSLRWSTVYTSDLSLSNGIGDWTIVEGEDDLFIYNNKNNKVYKFTLQEVDPSTATPKKS